MGYNTEKYEAVIGLEVHAQLLTKSKAYSSDINEYGELPNTNVSPITLAHPGTLPRFNEQLLNHAILLGLACKSKIREVNEFARKNYFYADMPKGYQITQDTTPICTGGGIDIKDADGNPKTIGLTRIHMEEDSGKSIHDQDPFNTLIDLNRAGIPLLEIVSEPEIRSGEEAYNYVTEVRKIVRYLDICDGNMEEGSLRCDANISVRLRGAPEFGTKVEVKNMNSIRNVQRAIEFEINRQIAAIEAGEEIFHETRSFDALAGTTFSMRSKEMANDYRYFPDPDLPPVTISQEFIDETAKNMPTMPSALRQQFGSIGLSEAQVDTIIEDPALADILRQTIESHDQKTAKTIGNWLTGELQRQIISGDLLVSQVALVIPQMVKLASMLDEKQLSSTAAKTVLNEIVTTQQDPEVVAKNMQLLQVSDETELVMIVEQVLSDNQKAADDVRSGEMKAIGFLVGQVMKQSQGRANPAKVQELIKKQLGI